MIYEKKKRIKMKFRKRTMDSYIMILFLLSEIHSFLLVVSHNELKIVINEIRVD